MENRSIEELRNGFDAFYQEKLLPLAQQMEKLRQKYFWCFIIGCVAAFILVPIIVYLTIRHQENLLESEMGQDWPTVLYYMAVLIILAVVASPLYLYRKKEKNLLMPEFIKYFDGFSYAYEEFIGTDVIYGSRLIDDFNRRQSDDYFYGTYKNVKMIVSEEKFDKLRVYYVEDKRKQKLSTVFDGILILFSMNKKFSGQTVVFQDKGVFNKIAQWNRNLSGLENVHLEDSRFEKEFEVYASDQVEARYLLTTAFMERMLNLRKMYHANQVEFSFFDNHLFISLTTKKNMFESTSLFKSCLDRKMIDRTFEQFLSIMSIIDILKLDKIQYTG